MIDNVSHVSYLKIFPGECDCTFDFDPISPFSISDSLIVLFPAFSFENGN